MSLFVEPRMSPTSGGNNFANSRYQFYESGTTTPATIYQDADRTITHTNPVVADSAGVFPPIWLDPVKLYRRVFINSTGTTISDVDPYPANPFDAETIAAALFERTPAEISAGVVPTNFVGDSGPYVQGNPRRYGAAGNGTTNDTTAVLNAVAVMKATYDHTNGTSAVWELNPGDEYLVTSPIHVGATSTTGGRIKRFKGNGAKFICSHTGIGFDMTNVDRTRYEDLWLKNGATVPSMLLVHCRYGNSSAVFGVHDMPGLKIEGSATIAGYFNYGSETNTFNGALIEMQEDTPFAAIITDSGRYCASNHAITAATSANPIAFTTFAAHGLSTGDLITFVDLPGDFGTNLNNTQKAATVTGASTFTVATDGSAYAAYSSGGLALEFVDVKPLLVNMSTTDPVLPGISTTNNHFHGLALNNKSAYNDGGRACIQFVGGGRHTFHGLFGNISDTACRVVQSVRDVAVGGTPIHTIKVFGWNPHSQNDVGWENLAGNLTGLELFGKHSVAATTADLLTLSGTLIDCRVDLAKVKLNGTASGTCQFRIGTSIEVTGATEGDVYLGNGATITFTGGTNATKRFRVFDSDSGTRYVARDSTSYTTTSTSGTGEDNLKSYSITGDTGFMGAANRKLSVRAAFTKTGGAGNKTIKYKIGTVSITIFPAANDTNALQMESVIETLASNSILITTKVWNNAAVTIDSSQIETLDMTSTQAIQFTGECANGADTISQTFLAVRQL